MLETCPILIFMYHSDYIEMNSLYICLCTLTMATDIDLQSCACVCVCVCAHVCVHVRACVCAGGSTTRLAWIEINLSQTEMDGSERA